jgi:hypothetical protein
VVDGAVSPVHAFTTVQQVGHLVIGECLVRHFGDLVVRGFQFVISREDRLPINRQLIRQHVRRIPRPSDKK